MTVALPWKEKFHAGAGEAIVLLPLVGQPARGGPRWNRRRRPHRLVSVLGRSPPRIVCACACDCGGSALRGWGKRPHRTAEAAGADRWKDTENELEGRTYSPEDLRVVWVGRGTGRWAESVARPTPCRALDAGHAAPVGIARVPEIGTRISGGGPRGDMERVPSRSRSRLAMREALCAT